VELYIFSTYTPSWRGQWKLELLSKTLDVEKVFTFFNIYYDQSFCMHVFVLHLRKRIKKLVSNI
jgi:hypothetical protein